MSDISNLSDTIVPNSNQLNADQLVSGPITITVTEIRRGEKDQPIAIHFQGDNGKPYLPCKTCRKILIFAWGDDGREWTGKRMTLFCDPSVKFGGIKVGGIRISHLSDIERDIVLSLNTTKGKKGEVFVRKMEPIAKPSVPQTPQPASPGMIAKVVKAFEGIGIPREMLESEYGKPIAEWTTDDVTEARAVFSVKKAERDKLVAELAAEQS